MTKSATQSNGGRCTPAQSVTPDSSSINEFPASEKCINCSADENALPHPALPAAPRNARHSAPPASPRREHPISPRHRHAIQLLVSGHSDTAVAKAIGIPRSTLYRWRIYHPTFQTELNRQRHAIWLNNADRLRSLMTASLDTLQKHLASDSERAAFRSAICILRLAKSAIPAGPLDEYDLLEEIYLREQRQGHEAEKQNIPWPPRKHALDELRDFNLHRARNQIFPTSPPPPRPPAWLDPELPEYSI